MKIGDHEVKIPIKVCSDCYYGTGVCPGKCYCLYNSGGPQRVDESIAERCSFFKVRDNCRVAAPETRKVIHTTSMSDKEFIALCDDGTMWEATYGSSAYEWVAITPIPQGYVVDEIVHRGGDKE